MSLKKGFGQCRVQVQKYGYKKEDSRKFNPALNNICIAIYHFRRRQLYLVKNSRPPNLKGGSNEKKFKFIQHRRIICLLKDKGLDNPGYEVSNGDTNAAPENGTTDIALDKPGYEVSNGDTNAAKNGTTKIALSVPEERSKPERAQWGSGLEFLMSCISMSVGLGNIWRFPFTAYENGGGAFLIPYIIVLIVIGRPLYYMEMSLGQFTSKGTIKMYGSLGRALKGIGYGQVIGSAAVATYYCSIMAVTLFYFVNSFTSDLPWATCWPEWEVENITCVPSRPVEGQVIPETSENTVSSSELYFTREVLQEITDISDGIGVPEWRLTLCLFVAWLITFCVSFRGVRSSGKAAYFLAIFPYVIMIALLVRAVTLPGADKGIIFFYTPDWDKLLTAEVWYAAVTQCFFSLSVGFGAIIMYSSYNNFEQNINRDAFIVTTLDTFTSLLAGTTIFGILGNLADEMGVDVQDVISSGGSGIAFISYPEAIAKFEAVPWLFAILFFGMLFILGVGSLMGLHNCANTAIMDAFPRLKSWQVSAATAIIGFLFGLVYVTPGGQFILNMVDHFGGTFIIIILVILEVTAVVWLYGLQNFCNDMHFMLKSKVGIFWRLTWGFIMPVLLLIIFIYFVSTLETITYAGHPYPDHILAWGWVILGVTMAQLIMWVVYYIYASRSLGFPEMISEAFSSEKWRPRNEDHYQEWVKFKAERLHEQVQRNDSIFRSIVRALFGR